MYAHRPKAVTALGRLELPLEPNNDPNNRVLRWKSPDVKGEVQKPVGETPFVVIPGDELDEGVVEGNTSLHVENAGPLVVHEVLRNELVVGPSEDALEFALRSGLDGSNDLVVGCGLGKLAGQVNNTDVGGGDTEGHTGELAVQVGDDLANSLGGTSGGGDDVGTGATASPPVLATAGSTVDGQLVGSGGVDGGHETLDNAELVVHNLGQGSQTVGGAASV
ncbi:glyceraldehyde-3-phosphate dehydrogenase, putative [Babesia ovata]|uniref:Glyceraldehyde-3-phosphate dehydrogenase, putative n=1 Tax=Babesia ovata TaxID=189622 RepID=A0A2H6KFC0_9APIC|nr:glyceraldehyde-3-phosphate dehydrogenase, putative [Babesia ovata]GBE61686.1 glyceraldehyde-3-phosphate dehydrogenase, putative [Babesia ovata]